MGYNFITINGVRISYLEKNTDAANTLFFIHGNSCTSNFWRKQTASKLFSQYRTIAFDLPWHGQSDAGDWADCSLTGIAKIMSGAVKNLSDGKPYILVGVSLGTNIVAEMLYHDLEPVGVVLAGPCIMGKNHGLEKMVKKGTNVDVVFTSDAPEERVLEYARETSLSVDPDDIRAFINDYHQTNKAFRGVLASSLVNYKDQVEIVKQRKIPSLVTFGADEKIVFPDYLDDAELPLWRGTIYKLEGASHLVNIDQPEEFNRLFAAYADERFK